MNNLALSETTPLNSVVYKLEGYDPEGGSVTFGLIGSENFEVDPTSGNVTLIKQLDREVRSATASLNEQILTNPFALSRNKTLYHF